MIALAAILLSFSIVPEKPGAMPTSPAVEVTLQKAKVADLGIQQAILLEFVVENKSTLPVQVPRHHLHSSWSIKLVDAKGKIYTMRPELVGVLPGQDKRPREQTLAAGKSVSLLCELRPRQLACFNIAHCLFFPDGNRWLFGEADKRGWEYPVQLTARVQSGPGSAWTSKTVKVSKAAPVPKEAPAP